METIIANHIVEVIIAIIGYFLVRSLKQVDKSIAKLDKTTSDLDTTTDNLTLEMQQRPDWSATKKMAKEVTTAAINEHIINDHKKAI